MPRLELTAEEARVLADTLRSELSDLSMEIADTDSMDFREKLKGKRSALEAILAKLD